MSTRRFFSEDSTTEESDEDSEDLADQDDVPDTVSVDMFAEYEENDVEPDDDDFIRRIIMEAEEEERRRDNQLNYSDANLLSPSPVPPTQAWNWVGGGNTEPAQLFDDTDSDWTYEFGEDSTELALFQTTFPANALTLTTGNINKFALETISNSSQLSRRQQNFLPVQNKEVLRYLAIRIFMGIDKKPEYSHYWSKDPLLRSPIVPNIMTSDRFFEITRYLHFCDNSEQQQGDNLHKIREIWGIFMENFSEILVPHQDLSIDETLIKFKGRLSWKQFIPSKRSRFGMKIFSIVDTKTGFILKSIIYAGKGKDDLKYDVKQFGYGGSILLQLTEPYFGKNHVIYADNYFTSPAVVRKLLDEKTYLCGTVRSNRKNLPKLPKLNKGEVAAFHADGNNSRIMVEAWKDKRIVRMISSGMQHEMVETTSKSGATKRKPESVVKYNKLARGIDLSDMQIHIYDTNRKCYKWYKKLFLRLVDMALYNALMMKRVHHPKLSFLQFRLNLIRQILELTGGILSEKPNNPLSDVPLRLTERHFMTKSPRTSKENVSNRRCRVCTKNKKLKRTIYWCHKCQVPLCAVPCFEIFHSKKNF